MLLLAFRVTNHRSIAATQELALLAVDDNTWALTTPTGRVLPAVGVYGPNASGKSALLDAMSYARAAVVGSHRWDPDLGTYRNSHLMGNWVSEPSSFEFDMLIGDAEFTYRFAVDDERVVEEELRQKTSRRPRRLFVREYDDYRFSRSLVGPKEAVRELTRPNSLFLSTASQYGHKELDAVARFFRQVLLRNVVTRRRAGGFQIPVNIALSRRLERGWSDVDDLVRLTRVADLGIEDLESRQDENDRRRVFLSHRGIDGEVVYLPFEEESFGTVAWLSLVDAALTALTYGRVLVVDELDRSLHPALTTEFLRLFQDPGLNRTGAQLIFTSHDVALLRSDNAWRLKRDQLWLTEKNSSGSTELYAATEFRGLGRRPKHLEDLYLQGRLGGTPVLDDSGLAGLMLSVRPPRSDERSQGEDRSQASLFEVSEDPSQFES